MIAEYDLPDPAERPRIEQLKPATLAVLEQRFESSWPDAWRELATSVYLSLIGRAGGHEHGYGIGPEQKIPGQRSQKVEQARQQWNHI